MVPVVSREKKPTALLVEPSSCVTEVSVIDSETANHAGSGLCDYWMFKRKYLEGADIK